MWFLDSFNGEQRPFMVDECFRMSVMLLSLLLSWYLYVLNEC